jgi:16S rRNA (guanine(966)-N(2))-methyltransferase RsmD
MRVIAGAFKGRPLSSVPGQKTRPTSDQVKEAIFNLVPNHIYQDGVGLDLFAGTGALGIEALSRGCAKMIFVDRHTQAIKVIYKNIHALNLGDRCLIYKQDVRRAVHLLAKKTDRFHIIFLDPPYAWEHVDQLLHVIAQKELLIPGGALVLESAKDRQLAQQYHHLILAKHHDYGNTAVRIYIKGESS